MSVAEQITRINNAKADIRQAIIDKGVDVDESAKIDTYAEKIGEISGGGGINLIQYEIDEGTKTLKKANTEFVIPSDAKILGANVLMRAFYNHNSLKTADLSPIESINGSNALDNAFSSCLGLESINLSTIKRVAASSCMASVCNACSKITSIDLSSLESITGAYGMQNAFQRCTRLTEVKLDSLKIITGQNCLASAFSGCTSLEELRFPALTTSSFGTAYKNQFNGMLTSVTGCTIHFPAGTESAVSALTGYPNFGGTNTVVLFDL